MGRKGGGRFALLGLQMGGVCLCQLLFRPSISGADNIPESGPAILVNNHISAGDTFLLPAMIKRRLTFPAQIELFHGQGIRGRVLTWFLKSVGQLPNGPLRRAASAGSTGRGVRHTPKG